MFGDAWFLSAMDSYLQLRLNDKNVPPTYVYLLTHKGSASYTVLFNGDPDTYYGLNEWAQSHCSISKLFNNAFQLIVQVSLMQTKIFIFSPFEKNCFQRLCLQKRMTKWEKQWYKCWLISLERGKEFLLTISAIRKFDFAISKIILNCNLSNTEIQRQIQAIYQNGNEQIAFR